MNQNPQFNVESGVYGTISQLLRSLDRLRLFQPHNIEMRYILLERLWMNLSPKIVRREDRERGDNVLNHLRQQLRLKQNGQQFNFDVSFDFEKDLREFIEKDMGKTEMGVSLP